MNIFVCFFFLVKTVTKISKVVLKMKMYDVAVFSSSNFYKSYFCVMTWEEHILLCHKKTKKQNIHGVCLKSEFIMVPENLTKSTNLKYKYNKFSDQFWRL